MSEQSTLALRELRALQVLVALGLYVSAESADAMQHQLQSLPGVTPEIAVRLIDSARRLVLEQGRGAYEGSGRELQELGRSSSVRAELLRWLQGWQGVMGRLSSSSSACVAYDVLMRSLEAPAAPRPVGAGLAPAPRAVVATAAVQRVAVRADTTPVSMIGMTAPAEAGMVAAAAAMPMVQETESAAPVSVTVPEPRPAAATALTPEQAFDLQFSADLANRAG